MFTLLIFGLVLLAVAVGLAAHAVILPRLKAAERAAGISAYGFVGDQPPAAPEAGLPALAQLGGRLGAAILSRTDRIDAQAVRRQLLAAGHYGTSAEVLVGYRALACSVGGLTWWVLSGLTVVGLLQSLVVAIIAWRAPLYLLSHRATQRMQRIDDELPDLIDLLVVTVEAGLSLGNALQVASRKLEGPLAEEVRLALQEQRMGLPMATALENMLERSESASMRSFVRSVVQGEHLGVSIGSVMRGLAVEMRKRRRAAAEERAQKAPIKLLFPLVFLIFPSIFVVLLLPAMLQLAKGLTG